MYDLFTKPDACVDCGEHIAILGHGDVAWHHGIYVGSALVVDNCKRDGVRSRSLKSFVEDNCASLIVKVKYVGDCSIQRKATIERAKAFLKEADALQYNLAHFNCETFAMICRLGRCGLSASVAHLLQKMALSRPVSKKCLQFDTPRSLQVQRK